MQPVVLLWEKVSAVATHTTIFTNSIVVIKADFGGGACSLAQNTTEAKNKNV